MTDIIEALWWIMIVLLITAFMTVLLFKAEDLRDGYNFRYLTSLRIEAELVLSIATSKEITEEDLEWVKAILYLEECLDKSYDYVYSHMSAPFFWVSERKLKRIIGLETWQVIKDNLPDEYDNDQKEALYSWDKRIDTINKIEDLHFI